MKITFVTGRGGKISVYGDGELIAAVDEDFRLSCGVKNEEELEGAKLAAFCEAAALRSAFIGAIRILSVRSHGKTELIRKLCQKGHSRPAAESAADRAEELGFIDDEAYALSLATRLMESKGYSVKRVRYELGLKGISREICDKTVLQLDNQPILRIIELLNTKYIRYLHDEKGIRKTVNALQRLGYRYSDIRSALAECEISSESEDTECTLFP